MSKEADDISILQDTRTMASWRKNNAEVISPETNNRIVNSRASGVDVSPEKAKSEDDEMKWKKDHRCADDILENQRKNNKNEINAKLNNQEHNHEAERKNDKDRKIRKIDLKAYGFENEFSDRKTTATRQRMVNRLDLSSYGYHDGILRRAHSNYQLNEPIMRNNEKSNLTRCRIVRHAHSGYNASKSFDFARDLNKLQDNIKQVDSRLISVKSMPNVADDMYYKASPVYVNQDQDDPAAKNLLDRVIDKSEEGTTTKERDAIVRDDSSSLLNDYDEISSDVERSFENIYIENKDQIREGVDKELQAMPSVKRLAQAFGRRQTSEMKTAVPAKVTRASVKKIVSSLSVKL